MSRQESCCSCNLIDYSEPVVILGALASTTGLVTGIVTGGTGFIIISSITLIGSSLAEYRIRRLGVAKELMDSVTDLNQENEKLKNEVNKFEDMVGLFGDNVNDLEDAKQQLLNLYDKYKSENDRQESNNLLTLFGLVDKNQDSKLSPEEINRLREYIKIVYKEEFDFDILDKDDDGYISLKEFFEKFRKRI